MIEKLLIIRSAISELKVVSEKGWEIHALKDEMVVTTLKCLLVFSLGNICGPNLGKDSVFLIG